MSANCGGIASGPPGVDPQVVAVDPAQLLQHLHKCHEVVLLTRIVRVHVEEHTDASDLRLLLRARSERPADSRRAAEESDELAAFHYPMPPVLPTKRIAHLGTAGGVLCCGISTRPMSLVGLTRSCR
jgi:hypothetical protein